MAPQQPLPTAQFNYQNPSSGDFLPMIFGSGLTDPQAIYRDLASRQGIPQDVAAKAAVRGGLGNVFLGGPLGQLDQSRAAFRSMTQDPSIMGQAGTQEADRYFNALSSQIKGGTADPVYQGLRNAALGRGPSASDAAFAAQRQAMTRDIAQQAAMQQRATYNPALARAALMQQGVQGTNLAQQAAAARLQERENARNSYLMARQQQLANQGDLAKMAEARYQRGLGTAGDIYGMGAGQYSQVTTAFNQNPEGQKQPKFGY